MKPLLLLIVCLLPLFAGSYIDRFPQELRFNNLQVRFSYRPSEVANYTGPYINKQRGCTSDTAVIVSAFSSSWLYAEEKNSLVLPEEMHPKAGVSNELYMVRPPHTSEVVYEGVFCDSRRDTVHFTLTHIENLGDFFKEHKTTDVIFGRWPIDGLRYTESGDTTASELPHYPENYEEEPLLTNWFLSRPEGWRSTITNVPIKRMNFEAANHLQVWDSNGQIRLSTLDNNNYERLFRTWDAEGTTTENRGVIENGYRWQRNRSLIGLSKSYQLGWGASLATLWTEGLHLKIDEAGAVEKGKYLNALYGFVNAGEAGLLLEIGAAHYDNRMSRNRRLLGTGLQLGYGWRDGVSDFEQDTLYGGAGLSFQFFYVGAIRGGVLTPLHGDKRGGVLLNVAVDLNLIWPVALPIMLFQ